MAPETIHTVFRIVFTLTLYDSGSQKGVIFLQFLEAFLVVTAGGKGIQASSIEPRDAGIL